MANETDWACDSAGKVDTALIAYHDGKSTSNDSTRKSKPVKRVDTKDTVWSKGDSQRW